MSHLSRELVERLVSGQAGDAETGRVVQHALACATCRTLVASAFGAVSWPTEGALLPALLQLAESEHELAIEGLLAIVEWAELRHVSPPRAKQERAAVKARGFRSLALVNLLLAEVRQAGTGDEGELIASLVVQAINQLDETKNGQLREDLKARAWNEVGNLRRREAKWQRAEAALTHAERLITRGTGDPLIEARLLSIKASLRSDQGRRAEAAACLQRCKRLYAAIEDWPLVARTLVQEADLLYEFEPEKALEAVSLALPMIHQEEVFLYAEILRGWCYIGIHRIPSALKVFGQTQSRWTASPQKRVRLRSRFFAGRLLEALGKPREAVRLYEEVISSDLHHELYKDAFLDLLYVFGFYFRNGDSEKATAICRRVLGQLEALNLVHEQLRVIWNQLLAVAKARPIDEREFLEVREYLRVFWKHPSPQPPKLSALTARRVIKGVSQGVLPVLVSEGRHTVDTLLAMAEWSALKQLSRKAKQERVVVKSKACHSPAFVSLLIAEIRSAGSGREAENVASLAVQAINLMDAKYGRSREDLRTGVLSELGNWRRREADWQRAESALSQAESLLARGTGDPIIEARFLSVKASLRSDQGRRSEAATFLQRCKQLYAEVEAWPLVARTLVQEADALYEHKPDQALEALSLALPMIREEEVLLYAEILRGWCYIGLNRIPSALRVFSQADCRWAESPQKRTRLRGRFFAGRLLEALGKPREAVRLFEDVVAEDLHHELYKDALLDLLYLFGAFIRIGDTKDAIAVCGRALAHMKDLDLIHEQLYVVWNQVMDAARVKAIDDHVLSEVREYLHAHWRHPAPQAPRMFPGLG